MPEFTRIMVGKHFHDFFWGGGVHGRALPRGSYAYVGAAIVAVHKS